MLKKQFKQVYSVFSIFLMLFQTVAPAAFFVTPAYAATEAEVVVSDVTLDFSEDTNEFVIAGSASAATEYVLSYDDDNDETPEEAIIGEVEPTDGIFAETLYAGTCSGEDCVADDVVSGTLAFGAAGFSAEYEIVDGVLWMQSGATATVAEVELGHTYVAPQNSDVTVTFTSLPENPGTLSIEEITLTDEQVEKLGAVSNIAYDITSSMEDGTFEYELTLPRPEGSDDALEVKHAESVDQLASAEKVETVEVTDKVTAKGLDHFTIFVVTTSPLAVSNVIDDGDTNFSTNTAWGTSAPNGYDSDHSYMNNDVADNWARWTFTDEELPTAGESYKILVHWVVNDNRSASVPFTLHEADGTKVADLATVDQTKKADGSSASDGTSSEFFTTPGTYVLENGWYVELRTDGDNDGYFLADAIKIVSAETPDEVWVDDDWVGTSVGDEVDTDKVFGFNAYSTIQEAVDAVAADGMVHVFDGVYQEQVVVNKNLTLKGYDLPEIVSPDTVSKFVIAESSQTWEPVVFMYGGFESGGTVSGTDTITTVFDGFIVDGNDRVPSKRAVGVFYRNANGEIKNSEVMNMNITNRETFGIMVYGDSDVSITGNSVTGYARGGIGVNGDNGSYPDPSADIIDNYVAGPGADEDVTWAPNGIQVGYGATGLIKENEVLGNGWPGEDWAGTSILVVDTSFVDVIDNYVYDSEQAISVTDFPEAYYGSSWSGVGGNSTIEGNTIESSTWGISIANEVDNVVIRKNTLTGISMDAIDVYSYKTYYPSYDIPAPTNVVVERNSISGVGADGLWVGDYVTETVDATLNWWGDASGPSGDAAGSGESLVGNATYCPWLGNSDIMTDEVVGDCLGEIQGRKYIDGNGNGYQDNSEKPGLSDWEIRLYKVETESRTLVSTMNTGDDSAVAGSVDDDQFLFENLLPGTYHVCEVQAEGYVQVAPGIGVHPQTTSGGIAPAPHSASVSVANPDVSSGEGAVCWEVSIDDSGDMMGYIKFGNQEIPSLGTPTQTGYNVNNGDSYASPRPVNELACTDEYTNINGVSVHWSEVETGNSYFDDLIKYQRQYNVAGGSWSGSEIYTTPYTNYRSFGGGGGTPGLYGSRVRAFYDLNGNNTLDIGEPTSNWSNECSVTYDNVAPDAPTLVEPTNNSVVNGATLLSDWSTVSDAEYYIYESYHNAGATNLRWHAEHPDSQKTATNVANATFWWRVKAVDAAGNESVWSELWKVTIDNDAPDVSVSSPAAGVVSGSVDVIGTVTDANPHHYWFVIQNSSGTTVAGPGVVNDTTSFTDKTLLTWDTTAVADGTYTIKLEARDAAENKDSGSVAWVEVTVDNTEPSSTITSYDLPDGGEVETATFSGLIEGTATDATSGVAKVDLEIMYTPFGSTDTVYWNGSDWQSTATMVTASGTDTWSYQIDETKVEEGIYDITSHATDNAGNVESTYTIKIVYDKTIPEVVLTIDPASPDGDNGWYRFTEPTITLEASDNYNVDYIEFQWNTTTDGNWTTYSGPINPPSEGQNILYYRAVDVVGNVSDFGVKDVKYDSTNPAGEPLNVRVENITADDADGLWEAPEDDSDVFQYKLSWKHEDGEEYGATVSRDTFEHVLDNLKDGLWTFTVRAVDAAGNFTEKKKDFRVGPGPSDGSDDGDVLGTTTTNEEIVGNGTGGLFVTQASAQTGADEEGETQEESAQSEQNGSDDEGSVLGESTCAPWLYYLPLLLLLVQLMAIIGFELFRREPSMLKIVVAVVATLAVIGAFQALKDTSCYVEGSWLQMIATWFPGVALVTGVVSKLLAYGFIEEA